ncbi:MAG: polyprenol monophosphomannose synthase [Sandaracinaceae bacterium]|nr:polyprenol monophosphomannose synthase [Sandaracinaceae bacterium]
MSDKTSDKTAARPRTLIVTPTYNEKDNLEHFVTSVLRVVPDVDVLIVDDNSPDGTGAIADRLAAADPRVRVMHRAGKQGLGTAYVQAFEKGLAEGYELFFEMDADMSHDPLHLPAFFDAFAKGADLVIGSRNIPGGGVVGWGAGRHFLSKGGSLYSRTILGLPIRDLTSGYKAFRAQVLRTIDLGTLRSEGYSFQIETTYRAAQRGFRVTEVPITFVDRKAGQSKMSRKIFVEAIGMVWRLRLG